MKNAEDVTKLFTLFGQENSGKYQEIHKTEQTNAARERWPVFQRVHIDADANVEPARAAGTVTRPGPRPVHIDPPANTALESPAVQSTQTTIAGTETQQAPLVRIMSFFKQQPAPGSVEERDDAVHAAPASSPDKSNSLKELFKRLEKSDEMPAIELSPVSSPGEPERPARSIRSLFSRISRP